MSLIAKMQKNDRGALDELMQREGATFLAFARALDANASEASVRSILWDASVVFRAGSSDRAFALSKLAEALLDAGQRDSATESLGMIGGLAARVKLGLADDAERRLLTELASTEPGKSIVAKVSAALARVTV